MSNIEEQSEYNDALADEMFKAAITPAAKPANTTVKSANTKPANTTVRSSANTKPANTAVKPANTTVLTAKDIQAQIAEQLQNTRKLYFISGMVELDNFGNKQNAEQTRIVWARDDVEAYEKFCSHFRTMNTQQYKYTVLGAAISEAID